MRHGLGLSPPVALIAFLQRSRLRQILRMPLPSSAAPPPPSLASSSAGPRPRTRALIFSRQWGVASEVWLSRQIEGFNQIQPEVVCWERQSHERPVAGGVPVHLTGFDPQPMERAGRWLLRLRNAPHGNYYGAVGQELRALQRIIRETHPEVVLCHFGHTALRVLPAANRCGVPLVAHFHGLDVSSGLRNRWYRTSILKHLSRFAAVVVVGSHQRQWMLDHGVPAERVHLIPCGVPTAYFTPPPRRQTRGRIRIAAVSRLVPWKGIEESLRALAQVRAQGIDAELHVVGDGPQRSELEALSNQLGLRDCVQFLGPRGPAEVRHLLGESDIFVQHSLTSASGWCEGFGVSIAEAAAMELPIVATRSGGIPDQVLDAKTGILVDERDVTGMADALRRLAEDAGLRASLGAAGRQRMLGHFDLEQQISKLETVMLRAAAGAG